MSFDATFALVRIYLRLVCAAAVRSWEGHEVGGDAHGLAPVPVVQEQLAVEAMHGGLWRQRALSNNITQGRAGQGKGKARQGRAEQGRAGQGKARTGKSTKEKVSSGNPG